MDGIRRLNWGCGEDPPAGWTNSDLNDAPGVDIVCDIRDGLPIEDGWFDYVVSMHALPMIRYPELVPVLVELRRVLKPGGVLRLGLPDVERGIQAFLRGDRDYFLVPDEDARSIGAKLIVQLLWYGYSRTLFVKDSIEEQLGDAGFAEVLHVSYGKTRGPWPEIVELDDREAESLFVEATK